MNAEIFNNIILQPELLKETSTEELLQLTEQYPFFAPAHFLLAAKKKQTNDAGVYEQIQKASVYFNEPLWFHYQLQQFSSQEKPFIKEELQTETTILNTKSAEAEIEQPMPGALADETDIALDAEAIIKAEELKEEETLINETEIELNAKASIEAADINETQTEIQTIEKANEPVFTFEPYHTVDYFASMGIKLKEEKLENDQLGQQVKSFTQWLRSMKKIYVEEKQELDTVHEQEVVNKAKESNQQTEVLTETMADILIKQGKLANATELYHKLSLLHPEKSAYFASRIEELKS